MRETINEEVSVVLYYSAKKREALPCLIRWQNKDYSALRNEEFIRETRALARLRGENHGKAITSFLR